MSLNDIHFMTGFIDELASYKIGIDYKTVHYSIVGHPAVSTGNKLYLVLIVKGVGNEFASVVVHLFVLTPI